MNHIFIESGKRGSNEFNFIKDIVFAACKQNLDEHYDIVNVNGFTSLPDFRSKFLEHKSPEEKNLVIFDADYPETNGGFEARTKSIRQYGEKLSIDFKLFLFPNNNADGIFANKSLKKDTFISPDEKAKIYSYIFAFKRSRNEQEIFKRGNWNFLNEVYWNLEPDYLAPLKDFLRSHLIHKSQNF